MNENIEGLASFKMDLYTLESGVCILMHARGVGCKSGQTVVYTKGTGKITKQTFTADCYIKTVIFTKVTGSTTKLTAWDFITIKTDHYIVATGLMTSRMAKGWNAGQTEADSKETINREPNRVLACSIGLTVTNTTANSFKTILKAKVGSEIAR